MTALLDAIARVFVAPSNVVRAEPVSAVAPSAAVCGAGAEPLACALALLLRRRGPAIVCTWGATARRPCVPPTMGARRLAASMAARGLTAVPSGRLVVVALDAEPSPAAAEAARAAAAAGGAPVVLALCGARDRAFDRLLAAQDLAVVAEQDAPAELVRLGVGALEDLGPRAVAAPTLGAASAWPARAGIWAPPGARRALAAAVGATR
jgi:hypothetical protein